MSDADCTPGREPRIVAASLYAYPLLEVTCRRNSTQAIYSRLGGLESGFSARQIHLGDSELTRRLHVTSLLHLSTSHRHLVCLAPTFISALENKPANLIRALPVHLCFLTCITSLHVSLGHVCLL